MVDMPHNPSQTNQTKLNRFIKMGVSSNRAIEINVSFSSADKMI